MRRRGTWLAFLGVLVCVVAALYPFGHEPFAAKAPVESKAPPTPPVVRGEPVATMTLVILDQIQIYRSFPGRIEAPRKTEIGFQINGLLAEIAVQEGDPVSKGDVLARLDAEAIEVELKGLRGSLAGLQAQNRLALQDVKRLERLVASGSAPAKSLEQARASEISTRTALSEAEAAVAGADLRLRQTELRAPADGYAGAVLARRDETLAAGQALVSIFENGANRLRVALPPNLDPTVLRNARLDVNGQEVPVTLASVRPDIDPASNSRSAVFAVEDQPPGTPGPTLLPGQTGKLVAAVTQPMRGAWVPLDALRPNPEGTWMLIGLSKESIAERIDVEVQYMRKDEAFVSGGFAGGQRVVAAGIHKVVPGQLLLDRTSSRP